MKRLFILIFLLNVLSSSVLFAQETPLFQWAKSFGGSGVAGEQIVDLDIDASGNIYVTGFFTSVTDFDPGAGTFNLTPVGGTDIFIAKFNASGNFVWAKRIGGNDPQDERAEAIDVDNAGNIYITGLFYGTVDFDPNATAFNLASAGSADAFILKLNTGGDFVWAVRAGGTEYEQALDIVVDNAGNTFTTGYFTGTADFDPGAGTVNLIPDVQDVFVLSLDNTGSFQWAKKFGGLQTDRGRTIGIDGAGDVVITGRFSGYTASFDFDPGPSIVTLTPNTTTTSLDIYIAKLNSTTGNIIWAKAIAGTLDDADEGIAIDNLDNILLTGYFQNTTDFDPGAGIFNLTAVGQRSPFIVKLTSSGDFVWAKAFLNSSAVGSPDSRGDAITTDAVGNVYASGQFQRTIDFDPGPGVFNLVALGQSDAYVTKLDANGNFVWAYKIGSTNFDFALGIAITASGEIYAAGSFALTADFDPGTCTFNMTSTGGYDAYIQKVTFATSALGPTITSFSPLSGPIGTTVTITGTNFSTTPANNIVTFNGVATTVSASTSTSITTIVPASATTGKISVTVNCNTVQSVIDFTVGSATQNFITQWNLVTAGSGATQLTFGTATSGTVNYTWQQLPTGASGSGSWSGATLTITGLPTGGTIRLEIAPANFQRIIINTGADRNRLTRVEQWGTTAWTSMQNAFRGCANLQVTATDVPDLSGLSDMSGMFSLCNTLNSPSNIGSWNTSVVTNMSGLFSQAGTFNQNISTWNTGAVTNMSSLFADAAAFNQEIGGWNTGAVTNMAAMFAGAIVFNRNIGAWNTAAVTNMNSMFFSAYAFNQNITGWNTAAVTNMASMFGYAYDFNQNIGIWNTAAVTNMSRMFEDAFDFNQNIGTWNTAAVTNMRGMFIDAYAFNQNIGTWNTSSVTDMSRMFDFATAFNQNIGVWNTAVVTDMSGMFADASAFNQNIGTWSLNPAVNLTGMFNNSGLDCANYSATLIGWSANPSTPNGRSLGATGRQYGTNAAAARTNLDITKSWTITGDTPSGTDCGSVSVPTITNFTPTSGPVGTTVTITGTNFSSTPANNTVAFNGTTAVVTASTTTSITTTVPAGATTGKISVTVAGNMATSANDFTVTTSGGAVTITAEPLATRIGGTVTKNLVSLITTLNNNLDINSIIVIVQPPSGAVASVSNGLLTVDYTNISFSGKESLAIRACDTNGNCTTQQFEIEVAGDIVVYNGISPNNDAQQLNEKLILQYIDILPETQNNQVTIYSRWGDAVWEGTNYNNDSVVFTGKNNNGNELPSGTYFYKIQFAGNRKTETGYLVIKK
jgi:surface protein